MSHAPITKPTPRDIQNWRKDLLWCDMARTRRVHITVLCSKRVQMLAFDAAENGNKVSRSLHQIGIGVLAKRWTSEVDGKLLPCMGCGHLVEGKGSCAALVLSDDPKANPYAQFVCRECATREDEVIQKLSTILRGALPKTAIVRIKVELADSVRSTH
jgi:hypothetical protein